MTAAVFCVAAFGAYVAARPPERVIKVTAPKYAFVPNTITLKKGVPVVLEFTATDMLMGFSVPALGVRTDIIPGRVARLRVVPDRTGTFPFHCDIFCGVGHEEMTGEIVVTD
jgi:cytochrome c oxidase subunit 2